MAEKAPAFKVRAFEAKDLPRVLKVLEAAMGQWPRDIQGVAPSEFFRWKHMLGPFGPSTLLVAEADGAAVGFVAYMPWRFEASGQILAAMRGVDLAVDPSYRRLGAAAAVRAPAHFPADNVFMWSNPNGQARPGGLSSGRREVGRLPYFVRPRGPLPDTIRRAWARGSKTAGQLRVEAETAAEVLRDSARVAQLLAQAPQPVGRLATRKDLEYLRWRYGQFADYRAIRTDPGEGANGIAIFRPRRHGSFWFSHVCELLVEHDDRRTARHLLQQVRDAAPADFTSCNFSSLQHAALHGFVQLRGGTVLMVYPLQQNLVPDPTKRRSWALSFGDLELL